MTPAIVFRRAASAGRVHGKALGPVVILPHDAPPHLVAHELQHVRQWWVAMLASAAVLAAVAHIVPAVPYGVVALSVGVHGALYRLAAFRFRVEAAAYAASARVAPDQIKLFARALASEHGTGRSVADCREEIQSRV
jgi:hypothetical protein